MRLHALHALTVAAMLLAACSGDPGAATGAQAPQGDAAAPEDDAGPNTADAAPGAKPDAMAADAGKDAPGDPQAACKAGACSGAGAQCGAINACGGTVDCGGCTLTVCGDNQYANHCGKFCAHQSEQAASLCQGLGFEAQYIVNLGCKAPYKVDLYSPNPVPTYRPGGTSGCVPQGNLMCCP